MAFVSSTKGVVDSTAHPPTGIRVGNADNMRNGILLIGSLLFRYANPRIVGLQAPYAMCIRQYRVIYADHRNIFAIRIGLPQSFEFRRGDAFFPPETREEIPPFDLTVQISNQPLDFLDYGLAFRIVCNTVNGYNHSILSKYS